jgi:hypothetical protein
MLGLCKYKDALGVPGEGIHKYRIADIAVVDVLLAVLLAFGIYKLIGGCFVLMLVIVFLAGIVLHRMFCVRTTVDKLLFPWDN